MLLFHLSKARRARRIVHWDDNHSRPRIAFARGSSLYGKVGGFEQPTLRSIPQILSLEEFFWMFVSDKPITDLIICCDRSIPLQRHRTPLELTEVSGYVSGIKFFGEPILPPRVVTPLPDIPLFSYAAQHSHTPSFPSLLSPLTLDRRAPLTSPPRQLSTEDREEMAQFRTAAVQRERQHQSRPPRLSTSEIPRPRAVVLSLITLFSAGAGAQLMSLTAGAAAHATPLSGTIHPASG